MAAHPGWRTSLVDVAIGSWWDYTATAEEARAVQQAVSDSMKKTRDLTTGDDYAQYLNEVSPLLFDFESFYSNLIATFSPTSSSRTGRQPTGEATTRVSSASSADMTLTTSSLSCKVSVPSSSMTTNFAGCADERLLCPSTAIGQEHCEIGEK